MKPITLHAANKLYICTGYSDVHRHKVYHALFHEFCMLIIKLEHELGEQAQDDYWNAFPREVKYYRFLFNAAPISMNSQAVQLLPSMQDHLRRCHYSFPQFAPYLKNLLEKLSILSNLPDNPLLESIVELVSSDPRTTALLLKESRLFPLVENVLATNPALKHIELVNQFQLRSAQCYYQLLVVGPSRWYPAYILHTPRAKEVHLIYYSWLAGGEMIHPVFVKPFTQQQPNGSGDKATVETQARKGDNSDELIEYTGQDIFPEINWNRISTKILRQTQDDASQEYIPAKLYLLASEQAVFLDANENTKVLVLDLEVDEDDEEELHQIKRVPISKVRPGMFLLLRTEGGGDYIVPIANRILRDKALHLRALQEQWKDLLRRAVSTKGLLAVRIELLDYGSKRANETNIRNWMSSRSIRPQDDEDFRAIMRLTGLASKEQEYRDAARQIESAHRQAGFYIREQLLKQVANADLQELHKRGFMDFELSEADGGSLTAFRIEHISPEISSIPVSRIGHLATMKGSPWH